MGLRAKITLGVLAGLLIGVGATLGIFWAKPELAARITGSPERNALSERQRILKHFDDSFSDDFFKQGDPFAAMQKFRSGLSASPNGGSQESFFGSLFEDSLSIGESPEISEREDDGFIYYDIKLPGVEGSSVKANVEGNYLVITGETKSGDESGDQSAKMVFQSTFQRSFPLPDQVDAGKMEMHSEQDKLVLKFPKRNK